jgi:hypothetical protein
MAAILKLGVDRVVPLRRGQEHFWQVMLALSARGDAFTASQILACSEEAHMATIRAYLRRLVKAGIAAIETEPAATNYPGRSETLYRLLQRPADPPVVSRDGSRLRGSTAQQALWNVMRGPMGRSGFTARDLVSWGSTDILSISIDTAKSYVKSLAAAGYLVAARPGGPNRLTIWRLKPSRNSGPRPPAILRAKIVWDQNRGKLAGEVIAEEVTP